MQYYNRLRLCVCLPLFSLGKNMSPFFQFMYLEWGRGKVVKRNEKYHIHKGYVFSLKHVFLSFSILMRSRRSGGMKKVQKLNLGPGLRDPENKPTDRSLRHSWTSCLTPMEPRRKNRGQLNLYKYLKRRKSPVSLSQKFSA